MFKKILFIAVALVGTSSLAQYTGDVEFGFRAGINYSSLTGDGTEDLDNRFGAHASFFADIILSEKLFLTPELGINALGANADILRLDGNEFVEPKINWLQSSIMLNYNMGNRLYLGAGPYAGVNVSENENNDYYNFDYGALAGVGYRFNGGFTIDVRYGYGFGGVFNMRAQPNTPASYNRYIQIGVAYRL